MFGEEFAPEAADANDPHVRTVLIFGETIGTLVKNGLLDRGLVLDWLWAQGLWERVGRRPGKHVSDLAPKRCMRTSRRWRPAQAGQPARARREAQVSPSICRRPFR